MGLLARVAIGISGNITKALSTGGQAERQFWYGTALEFKDGAGANQANKLYAARLTIAAASQQDIDLSGTLENELGDAVVFTAIKAILVRPISGPNPVVVGNAAVNPWVGPFGAAAHTIAVPQGGEMAIGRVDAPGWPVGAGATDILRLANAAGGPVDCDIVIVGI